MLRRNWDRDRGIGQHFHARADGDSTPRTMGLSGVPGLFSASSAALRLYPGVEGKRTDAAHDHTGDEKRRELGVKPPYSKGALISHADIEITGSPNQLSLGRFMSLEPCRELSKSLDNLL